MNILVLQGSLKGEKGITELLVNKFLSGIMRAEPLCHVEVKYLCTANIQSCSGCLNCWVNTPGVCRHEDDMTDLIRKYEKADIIIAAAPVYFDGMSSHMKKFWERMFPLLDPYFEPGPVKTRHKMRKDRAKGLFVISACGFPETMQFDALVLSFKRISYNLKMDYLGHLLRPECHSLSLIKVYGDKIEYILRCFQDAGEELIRNHFISQKTIEDVQQPVTADGEEFIKINNIRWDKVLKK